MVEGRAMSTMSVKTFYLIVNEDGLYWNHAGNDTYNVMDATWFDTRVEAVATWEDLDVSYVDFQVKEFTIEQQSMEEIT
jgi:hypothetical protein